MALRHPAEFYNHFHNTATLLVIVDLIYLNPKLFSLLNLVKLLFSYNIKVLACFIEVDDKRPCGYSQANLRDHYVTI